MALQERRTRSTRREAFTIGALRGWNDDQNNDALDDRDLRVAKNVMRYPTALLGSRPGTHADPFAAALNSGAAITGLFDFHAARDTIQRVIVIAGDKIYAESAGADPSTVSDITGAAGPPTAGGGNVFTGTVFKDQLLITNGVEIPIAIPSSGNAADLSGWFSNSRVCRYIFAKWGFVFTGGFTGTRDTGSSQGAFQDPMAVYHSELYDDTTWLENNVLTRVGGFSAYGDEYVTALFEHRDFLMVGTNRRIYPVSYTGDVGARFIIQRPLNVGVADQRSVVSLNGQYTFFIDPDGDVHTIVEVAEGFGDIGIQSISRKIRNHTQDFTRSMIPRAVGVYWKDLGYIFWSVPVGSGSNLNEIIALDLSDFPLEEPDHRRAIWYRWTSRDTAFKPNCMAILRRDTDSVSNTSEPDVDGKGWLYFGTDSGWVKRFNETIAYDEDDSGSALPVDTAAYTKWYDFGFPHVEKSVAEIQWDIGPASASIGPNTNVAYDFGVSRSTTEIPSMGPELVAADQIGIDFAIGVSAIASADELYAHSRKPYSEAGKIASIEIARPMAGTDLWKLQRMTPVVNLSGVTPETHADG